MIHDSTAPIATAIGLVEIRPATAADVEEELGVLDEAARWLAARGINQWPVDGFPRDLIAADIARAEVHIARCNRRAVGTFTLQWSDQMFWPGAVGEAGYVHRIAVRREARGIGVELLKAAECATVAAGRKLLRLDCYAGNEALCAYYERAGFVRRADIEVDGRGDATVPASNVRFLARQYEKLLP
ncbi:MAG TPA: GNAT family N-acetyltransferase [Candidatus Binatus sp.]|nr:GNAT family N-acetyltransferase [Candidatus Binatus sp.]